VYAASRVPDDLKRTDFDFDAGLKAAIDNMSAWAVNS
jgi:hypothetical protein